MNHQTYELSPQQQLLYINSNDRQPARTGMTFRVGATDTAKLNASIDAVLAGEQQLRMSIRYHAEEGIPVVMNDDTGKETIQVKVTEGPEGTVLVQMDADSYFFDTCSLTIVMDKILAIYNGKEPVSPAIDYLQYAAWKNQLYEEQEENHRFHWETSTRAGFQRKISFELNSGNASQLRCLTSNSSETLFNVLKNTTQRKERILLAGWYLTLWKLSGEIDNFFSIGYIHHGRSFRQLYRNTGAFASNLPFLPNIIGNALSVQEYLQELNADMDILERHKEYMPGNKEYYRFAARSLAYQFEYIDQALFAEETDFMVESSSIHDQPLKIRVQLHHSSKALTCCWFYDASTFAEEEIHFVFRLWEHYCIQLLTHSGGHIGELPVLPGSWPEMKVLPRECTVTDLFSSLVKVHGNKPAVADSSGSYTYQDLDNRANALAAHLLQNGIDSGTRVGILCDAGFQLMVFMLGILKAGASYVPIDAAESPARITHIAGDAQLRYVLTEEKYTGIVLAIPGVTPVYDSNYQPYGHDIVFPERTAADTAYVIYTSGTTGKPKGVAISDSSLANYVQWLQTDLGISSQDSSILLSSYAFDLGYTAIWGTVLSGGTIHFVNKDMLYQTDEVLDYIIATKITFLKLTPAYFSLLVNTVNIAGLGNSALRMILLGGEKINVRDVKTAHRLAPQIQFVNHYGPTETTVGCIAHKINAHQLDHYANRPVIGKAISNNTAYVLDAAYNRLSPGMKGSIFIGGAGLAKGYLHQEALTVEKFMIHPQYGRLYDTGDTGIQFLNGDILFLGRSDNQVKIRGYRVETDEVKRLLETLPGISSAVVYVTHMFGDPSLVAFIMSQEVLDMNQLREDLKVYLPDYMIPSFLRQIDRIPVTANNKTDYYLLDVLLEKKTADTSPEYSPELKRMINIWKEVLAVPSLDENSNFFSMGGHSLKAIQLLSRVRKEFSVKLSLKDIYKNSTPKELVSLVPVTQSESYEGILPVPVQERYRVSNSQKRMWLSSLRKENRHLFNVPLSYRIKGDLNTAIFENAFRYLIKRHESLRTTFRFADGEIFQYVLPDEQVQFSMPLVNGPDDPAEIIREESLTPFDLENDIPIRVKVIKLAQDDHILLITLHHIVSDGWSREIIYKEVLAVYNAMFNNTTPELTPLQIQYKDYVYWHEQQYAAQEAFWKTFFSAGTPSVNFPLDYPRPTMISHSGFARTTLIDGEKFRHIRSVLEKRNINKTDFCIALFGLLLHGYTAQQEFMIGTITSGRTHIDLEPLIGTFINFLPLKIRMNTALTLEEYIQSASQEFLRIYANEDYPFDLLVEKFVQHTDYSRNPVFDTTIIFHNEENMVLAPRLANDAEITEYISSADLMEVAKIDFKIDITFRKHEMVLRLEYNTRLFRHETMLQLLGRYEQMLTSYPDLLDKPVSTLLDGISGISVVKDDEIGELII